MELGNKMSINDPPSSNKSIVIERITNLDNFAELETPWNALLAKSGCEPACLHWKWMQLWWRHFSRQDYQPVVLLFRQADELVAIFPLVVIPVKRRVSKERILYFLGTGENEIEEITTEYIDIIALSEFEQVVAEEAARYLTTVFTQWDSMELMRYSRSSVLERYFLPALKRGGIPYCNAISGFRHFVRLNNDYESYLADRNRSFRKKIRMHNNRLKALGKLEIRQITSAEQIDDALNTLRELHLRRFEHLTSTSAFISQRFTDYHHDLMHWLYEQNRLMFLMYVLDGKVISAEYNFIINNTVYAYQGSFDPDIKRLSLGFLSINEMIKESIARGASIYDFMMGGENHYASIYGCERELICTCYGFNRSIKSRLAFYWVRIKISSREMRVVLQEVWSLIRLMM